MSLFSQVGRLVGDKLQAILAVSAYSQQLPGYGPDPETETRTREAFGGNISPLPQTKPRWYMADIETAMAAADQGDLTQVGELCRAMRRDGMISGLLATRTEGLVQLPLRWYGSEEQVAELKARNGTRSLFEEMFPPAELALLAGDGILAGVGVGELVPVRGRDFPVFCRLDPAYLRYRWNEGRWYFNSLVGPLPITPGDGRWILHTPGGRVAPWQHSAWRSLGRAFITKEHSWMMRQNYAAKLANPARIATAPLGASELQKLTWLEQVVAWGMNTVFSVTPGYKVELLELKGAGYKVFAEDMIAADHEIMIQLAGQEVTTTGGAGFSNMDLFRAIKADLIRATGNALAYTVNTQGIPPWVVRRYGVDALNNRAIVEWDTAQPKDLTAEANSLVTVSNAIEALRKAAAKYGRELDVAELFSRFSVPVLMETAEGKGLRTLLDVDPDSLAKLIEIAKASGLQPTTESIVQFCEAVGLQLVSTQPVAVADSAALDPDGDGEPGEPPTDDSAQRLADKMTEQQVDRCEHGAVNRCRLCGIERVRDFERDPETGEVVWKIAWRPIPKEAT